MEDMEIAQAATQYFLRRRPIARYVAQDLLQQAVLVVLDARQTYDPDKGPFKTYCYRAVLKGVQRHWWEIRDDRVCNRAQHGLERACPTALGEDPLYTLAATAPSPASLAEDRQLAERVYDVLRPLDPTEGKLGLAAALGLVTSSELARQAAVPVAEVYRARKEMTRRARRSSEAQALYEEIR
jgi:RNA polymerase sigma factor (sigma-70 family)